MKSLSKIEKISRIRLVIIYEKDASIKTTYGLHIEVSSSEHRAKISIA